MSNPQYKCHLFICTQNKESGSFCGAKSAAILRSELKKRLEEKFPHLKSFFRVNASGCLSQCKKGIAAVSYPQGQWFTELNYSESELERLENFVLEELEKANILIEK